MRMLGLLRSRTTILVVSALLILGMVATGAVGLVNALGSPGPSAGQAPSAQPDSPMPAPALDELGDAPRGASYTDFGEQCPDVECVRIVGVATKDGEDTDEAVEKVFGHLLDQGWARILPNQEADPDDVPLAESYLTNGSVMVTAAPVDAPDTTAGLMLMHAQEPDS
ncbi:hypothetical protein LG943_16630 [Streptomonospora sp. S1-112]|uniref:Uncharacterized protein n=1 Tax=Streptomonospora mangrovi TaxID=2883123 RepID=A0A9X3NX43_9ACTN|nr:hypothetical protein [Streptomonospora mangrovi]MDA0565926.1 hypothetical protein [Streptomonospora mangrovi]